MLTVYPDAIQMLVPHDNVFWNANPNFAIVIHGTAGWQNASAQDVANMFATVPDKRSSHFIVGRDGAVVQCVTLDNGAGANCCLESGHDPFWDIGVDNLNTVTISIEHVHWMTDNSEPLTDVQKQASFQLVKWLCDQTGIDTDHIKGHNTLDPQSRAQCPGNYPWNELFAYLQNGGNVDMLEITDPYAAAHFQQVATGPSRWFCPETGQDLFAGILEGWRKMMGAPGLPLGPEVSCGAQGAVYKVCQNGIVVWDPGKQVPGAPTDSFWGSCYLLNLNSDLARKILALNLTNNIDAVARIQAAQTSLGTALKDLGAS